MARDAADAVAAAFGPPGQVATLILPADVCWLDSPGPVGPSARAAGRHRRPTTGSRTSPPSCAPASPPPSWWAAPPPCEGRPSVDAARIAAATGAKLLSETFPPAPSAAPGVPAAERLAYLAEIAQAQLDGLQHLVLVDAASPVSFFAYPDKASDLVPEGCTVHVLAAPGRGRARRTGGARPTAVGAATEAPLAGAFRPDRPTGALNAETMAAAVGALLPEGAIVVDEGNTTGLFVSGFTAGAPRHDWLCLTGGAIGYGLPVATGAAVAAPRPQGAVPAGRRQRDVHVPGAVDAGARGARRDHRDPEQPVLRRSSTWS